ncbi:Vegetative incompatibility protein HET-E-1-like protein 5 [Colletotrichum chlorophyti]|uniref:Vegetative incompatibility protein HET-E-1-like protein 5 n=1 Tax=Colletotrichum chlorophyti TaxID=708187 RepID=A0A1Q8RGC0_9PEZI|nr:Vegetative incompatibility protein HET-E-1-like protein 5 [Colletotrichum chlorophyti]
MYLLHVKTRVVRQFDSPITVDYAILSHTFSSPSDDEWFRYGPEGFEEPSKTLGRYAIIDKVCQLTEDHGLDFVWIDAVCIDKSSSTAVAEAVNAIPQYLKQATLCFAYLADLPCYDGSSYEKAWADCCFWTKAWTLQELILPDKVQFYDAHWHQRGDRSQGLMPSMLSKITGVDEPVLKRNSSLMQVSAARKMCWAARRHSNRPEDTSYSLLGLFGIHMPVIYGEGGNKSFQRLQEEILKNCNDISLLSWVTSEKEQQGAIFARRPKDFEFLGHSTTTGKPCNFKGFTISTSIGILLQGSFAVLRHDLVVASDFGSGHEQADHQYGVVFQKTVDGRYMRVSPCCGTKGICPTITRRMAIMVVRTAHNSDANLHWRQNHGNREVLDTYPSQEHFEQLLFAANDEPLTDQNENYFLNCDSEGTQSRISSEHSNNDWVLVSARTDNRSDTNIGGKPRPPCEQIQSPRNFHEQVVKPECSTEIVGFTRGEFISLEETWDSDLGAQNNDVENAEQSKASFLDEKTKVGHRNSDVKLQLVQCLVNQSLDSFQAHQHTFDHLLAKRQRAAKRPRRRRTHYGASIMRRSSKVAVDSELSCPFYKKDPSSYEACLRLHEMKNMDQVRTHLWEHHRLPYYCPKCKSSFELATHRDLHIVQRNCKTVDVFPFFGLSEDHKTLIDRTRQIHGAKSQWLRVWDILFRGSPPPSSPYLLTGPGLNVAEFRRFWHRQGLQCLLDCLSSDKYVLAPLGGAEAQDVLSNVYSEAIKVLARRPA